MNEANALSEPVRRTDIKLAYNEFPTTPAIIEEGVRGFESVYRALPTDLRSSFIKHRWMRTVFLDVTPQKNLDEPLIRQFTPDQLTTLQHVIHTTLPHMKFYFPPHHITGEPQSERMGFINLHAANHVIQNNADYFPPGQW